MTMKFIALLLKNLGRNKIRTTLTALAVVVLATIYTLAISVTSAVNRMIAAHDSNTRLIVREKWVMPSRFPARYVRQIAALDGVKDWTTWNFYAGYVDDAGHNAAGIATRIDNIRQMHPGFENLNPALLEAMRSQRNGVLMGTSIMSQMRWKVGQKFTLTSFTHVGRNLEFQIVGVLPAEIWANNFFLRDDYYREGVDDKDTVNIVWLRVGNEEQGKRLAAQIEGMFAGSRDKLRVETESAGVSRFMGRTSSVVNIINFVVTVLLIDMVVVLSNSISMTVRERRREMAILKILGFQPRFILMMIVSEATVVGAAGGALGAGLAYAASVLNVFDQLPTRVDFLLQFPVSGHLVFQGMLIGAAVGLAGSIFPAWKAQGVNVIEAFSNAG